MVSSAPRLVAFAPPPLVRLPSSSWLFSYALRLVAAAPLALDAHSREGLVVALARAPLLGTPPVWLVPPSFRTFASPRSLSTLAHNGVRGMSLRARRFDPHPCGRVLVRIASSMHRARDLRIARASRCPWPRSAGTSPRISTRVDGLVNASSRRRRSSSSSSSATFVVLASSSQSALRSRIEAPVAPLRGYFASDLHPRGWFRERFVSSPPLLLL